ncbi:MAG TPA: hypothetical protein ENN80_03115, partial [Candidatus Hydrogenedentes bacterium]|nr:hypothetical protein [Candidatus Hydrogenedentota bacterium]
MATHNAIVLGALSLIAAGLTWSAPADEVRLDPHTPHVAWGRPLAGGPIRALFVAPRFTVRDVGELALRLDVDADVVPMWDAHHVGCDPDAPSQHIPGASASETLDQLERAIERKHDLVVAANIDADVLPARFWALVREHVAGGAGLLLANMDVESLSFARNFEPVDAGRGVVSGIGEAMTPEWYDGLDFVQTSTLGNGRVVVLNYAGKRPMTQCLLPSLSDPVSARPEHMDVYYSLVARAARWAAGRDAAVRIEAIEFEGIVGPSEEAIPPHVSDEAIQAMQDSIEDQPYRPYRVRLDRPAPRDVQVKIQIRDPHRALQVVYPPGEVLRAGQRFYPFRATVGPGRYFFDAWLLSKNRVIDWYTEVVAIPGWPEFARVDFSKTELLANDALDITATVRSVMHKQAECMIYAQAVDTLGRTVAETYATLPGGGTAALTLALADLIAPMVKVNVFAIEGPRRRFTPWDVHFAAHASLYLPVRRVAPVYRLSLLGNGLPAVECNTHAFLAQLAATGLDTVHAAPTQANRFALAQANLYPLPKVTQYVCPHAVEGVIRLPCLTDPAYHSTEESRIVDAVSLFETGGSGMYSLGDGNCLIESEENVCQSETCLEGFRKKLKERYATLDALNDAWGTRYPTWGEVAPCGQYEAMRTGLFAPWVAFRRHMDGVFAEAHRRGREIARQVDRRARVGFRAAEDTGPYRGYDWWKLASQLDVLGVPDDAVIAEQVRSVRAPDAYTGVCIGGRSPPREVGAAAWRVWHALFQRMPVLWIEAPFGTADLGSPHTALSPDGRPSPFFAALCDAVGHVQDLGLDALLLQAAWRRPALAVYASRASALVNHIEPSFGATSHETEAALLRVLGELGYPYDFVSPEQAMAGRLDDYLMLFLPMTRALSDPEVAAITRFHEQGGHLVADIAPGQFDDHGVMRDAPALDCVFDVQRDGAPRAILTTHARVTLPETLAETISQVRLTGLTVDASLLALRGEIWGEADGTP